MTAPTRKAPPREGSVGEGALPVLAAVLELLGSVFERAGADERARAAELAQGNELPLPTAAGLVECLNTLAHADECALDVEYVRLFLHGRPATAHPYESFYRTGLLMDPDCLSELDALFAAAGVVPPHDGAVARDHLAVELPFLALLLRGLATSKPGGGGARALRAIAARMLDEHLLPFSRGFCARLDGLSPTPYFGSAGAALPRVLALAGAIVAGTVDPASARQ